MYKFSKHLVWWTPCYSLSLCGICNLLVAWGALCCSRYFFTCVLYAICLDKNTIAILLNNCKGRLYGVDSLFSFSCLNNTLSPFWISLSCAFLLQFAHTFPFSFLSLSLSLTSSSSLNSCSWGSLVLMHLPNNISVGLTPVVVWGVLQYIIKKLSISHLQLRPFAWAICRHFRILRFFLSISHLLVAIRVWFASVQFHSLLSTFWNSHW